MTMIESMARAIDPNAFVDDDEWDRLLPPGARRVAMEKARNKARAALEAMREPSAAMVAAAIPHVPEVALFDREAKRIAEQTLAVLRQEGHPREADMLAIAAQMVCDWRAMIDAALAEAVESDAPRAHSLGGAPAL